MQGFPDNVQYAGFWDRFMAFLPDLIVQALISAPLLYLMIRSDLLAVATDPYAVLELLREAGDSTTGILLNYVLPALYFVLFWKFKAATPGKSVVGMTVVDADTGGKPTTARLVIRYLGYWLNVLTFLIGFFWVAFDKRKQGLHDKMARTVVIMTPPTKPQVDANP